MKEKLFSKKECKQFLSFIYDYLYLSPILGGNKKNWINKRFLKCWDNEFDEISYPFLKKLIKSFFYLEGNYIVNFLEDDFIKNLYSIFKGE